MHSPTADDRDERGGVSEATGKGGTPF